ncbi:MAG: class I SAM-dependent methyltransferase [Anaerolineae bacterium]|jgi:ubiquinone/menaquinone biosynthesis C-methylase UbiE
MDDLYGNWAQVYDTFYPDRSEEVAFWARVAARFGRRVLDLMCGTAEISLGLARHSCRVFGMDISPAMLSVGVERQSAAADDPARNLSLIQADALALPTADDAFDFAQATGSGSLNHLDDDQAATVLAELYRVLRPGGGIGLELVNPYLLEQIDAQRTIDPLRPAPGTWVKRLCHNHYEPTTGIFHIEQVTYVESGGQEDEFAESFSLHAWFPGQVRAMLRAAGFGGVQLCGSYGLEPFDTWSADLLVVAKAVAVG